MHDSVGHKLWEVPVGVVGMVAGAGDAAFNVMTLGGKGAIKEGIKVGVQKLSKLGAEKAEEKLAKEGTEKAAAKLVKENAEVGAKREAKTAAELASENPGKVVQNERTLRNAEGEKVIDPVTGEGRRVDHAVIDREANTAKTYETTGQNVDKEQQLQKEARIREEGGTYIRDKETKKLVPVQDTSTVIRQP